MTGLEDFKGLPDGQQQAMRDLLADSMARGANSLGGAPVEPAGAVQTPGAEVVADGYSEAALLLPIAEELDGHAQHGPYD